MSDQVRVLVIDDSALMRKLIPQIIERDPAIKVVGTAMDGEFGLRKVEELQPHVVTLDLDMPRMDGMETLRHIMRSHRIPVIMVSAMTTAGANSTFKALGLGAFDFVAKPKDAAQARMDEIGAELIQKIKAAAKTKMPAAPAGLAEEKRVDKPLIKPKVLAQKLIAVGISTGGPNALQYMLSQLPGDFPAAIVVVQHMPEGFTDMFARRLDESCAIDVKEAQSGDLLLAGRALICPGNRHIRVRRMTLGNMVVLSDEERVNGHRPSADVLFHSTAAEFGPHAIGLIMTGMGEDGAEGLGAMRRAGALTIAQDEQSCVVFGMPKAAIDRGHAQRTVSLEMLANTLVAQSSPSKQYAVRS
ncbi:MAG: chemotaxis response regulator protein-glutamate methylesterase [Acidobacteriales bacterium]|nr:chemotaxis response regulator protein-glutamate methylesterase [Terriglobales bacterium]